MCVHFTPPPPKVLKQLALFDDLEYRPETYPKYKAPIIRKVGDETVASLAGFGLVPRWAPDTSYANKTYNARTETVHEKPSYRTPWAKRQFCLVPMVRYFEPCWETGKAVNWAIKRVDNEVYTCAAIWDTWTDKATGEILDSFSMLTINADDHPILGRMQRVGDEKRSLVVVNEDRREAWLMATKKLMQWSFANRLMFRCLWVNLKRLRYFKSLENQPPNKGSKPLKQNWLGQWVEVQETEPLGSYTQVLLAQETEPHYNALMERLKKLKVEQSKKL